MSRLATVAVPVLLLAVAPPWSAAQSPRLRRWEVSLTGGGNWGNSRGAIEAAMRGAGLDDTHIIPAGCYIIVCTSHDVAAAYPRSVPGSGNRMLAVSYALRPWLRVRVQQGSADLGWTTGHREPSGYLEVGHRVTTVAALVVVGEGLYLGAGPSINSVRVGNESPGTPRVGRVGAVLHAGLKLPERRRFFFTVTAQYHYVGSVEVGPYTVQYDWVGGSTVTMPRTWVSSSYRALRGGIGVAL